MKGITPITVIALAVIASRAAGQQLAEAPKPTGDSHWKMKTAAPVAAHDTGSSPLSWDNVAHPGGKLPGAPTVQLVRVADGFHDPTSVASPTDGTGRVFVAERAGRVKVVMPDGKVLPEPFIDLTGAALPLGGEVQHQFLEQGLYSIAFHPKYKENGFVYVHYSSLPYGGDGFIVRFKVSPKDANKVDPASAKVVMQLERPYYNHNGGQIAFGPDGYMYIGSGDGGWEGDPLNAGQDLATNLGKILRIDVNTEEAGYKVPETNPMVSKPQLMALFGVTDDDFNKIKKNHKPEIWAWGVRNPWQFSFDSKTGDLYIADVGQSEMEPILYQPAGSKGGENYGWNYREGTKCFPKGSTTCPRVGVPPAAEYSHDQGCAVMGFGVYRGEYAALNGSYLVGDWCSGKVWGLGRDQGGKWQFQELLTTGLAFTGGGTDEKGNVYAVNCTCFYTTDKGADQNPPGSLWKAVAADKVPPKAVVAPSKGAVKPKS